MAQGIPVMGMPAPNMNQQVHQQAMYNQGAYATPVFYQG
eukprot:CAMPEP_0116882282 /NCGR_PEP_ID=MMETSP0463-20121206/14480_1 /TAXON_ID=181622 /ORGANISM="Strombidinopsis sp, Strain SopsisLIS2011" /LENGTH=38 /DNA_ID= /DNA_START= /DNA_END= /DNA_ORIENTATION=